MNIFKKAYCRIYQGVFKIAMPLLPYREPTTLDSVLEIKSVLKSNGIKKVLLVTDKGLKERNLTDTLENDLRENEIECIVYDGTVPNPTIDCIEEAKQKYIENSCEGIIAFGGGSVMDCAKVVGARVVKPNQPIENMKGLLKIRKKLPLLIAIPTTAGTGSETTLAAVITDSRTHHKYPINDFSLIPPYAVLDPSLTYGLPKSLTATTGMDALTHAIEAYIGKSTTKKTRTASLTACKLIFENLPIAYSSPKNKEARANMLKASYLAGVAFTRSYVGYVHAVAHSLGGKYGTPHGLANAVILPYFLTHYGSSVYKKLKAIAVYSGIATEFDSPKIASSKLINKITALNSSMGIPNKIEGIKEKDIPSLAILAEKEGNPLYPVPKLMTAKELEEIYHIIMK